MSDQESLIVFSAPRRSHECTDAYRFGTVLLIVVPSRMSSIPVVPAPEIAVTMGNALLLRLYSPAYLTGDMVANDCLVVDSVELCNEVRAPSE